MDRRRLDEILINEGLVTESQVKQVLALQKTQGGRFGSHLLYQGHIDEPGLVRALATQMGSEGVVLSGLVIPRTIINCLPARVAVARKIIPFEYDAENNILKVACENPNSRDLLAELNFVVTDKSVLLYVAAELALNTAIARYYLGRETPPGVKFMLEIPGEDPVATVIEEAADEDPPVGQPRGSVLLVTDDIGSAHRLQSILSAECYKVTTVDSADDAIDMIGDSRFHSVFIRDTVSGDYIDLIDRLRKAAPSTRVRYYESAASLLLETGFDATGGELLLQNLELFTSMLARHESGEGNHSGRVGRYADRLCRRLDLPAKERVQIICAAYIHNLSRFYYPSEDERNYREEIDLTVKLLKTVNYPPVVVGMLRCMYKNLKGRFNQRLPIENLGGNIITIVDLFCDHIPADFQLSLDRFQLVETKIRGLIGKLFLTEVAEAFIEMVHNEMLDTPPPVRGCQLLIRSDNSGFGELLEDRLTKEHFRIIVESDTERFCQLYRRSQPDIILLVAQANPPEAAKLVREMSERGVQFDRVPTLILTDFSSTSKLTGLLRQGIEDIIACTDNFDFLVTKLKRVYERLSERTDNSGTSGTRGTLADMNLIDLLQALGPSRKTLRLSVTRASAPSLTLTIHMHLGQAIHAELGDLAGAGAIYEAITWSDGTWAMQSLDEDSLPEPNVHLSNESILMEGCRLMDERTRTGELPIQS